MSKAVNPPPEPNVVWIYRGENERIIGYIADNCIENDPETVNEHLEKIARIRARKDAVSPE